MVIVYLGAIVAANLLVGWFGPAGTIFNAFVFIGLDITARDRLHDKWTGRGMPLKMAALIAAGGAISWTLNNAVANIALASTVSFAAAATVDGAIYHLAKRKTWIIRSNSSNIASAAVDSALFPLLAFGWPPMVAVMVGQFAAKVLGGLVWSFILRRKGER